jgi:hypothetical protein
MDSVGTTNTSERHSNTQVDEALLFVLIAQKTVGNRPSRYRAKSVETTAKILFVISGKTRISEG